MYMLHPHTNGAEKIYRVLEEHFVRHEHVIDGAIASTKEQAKVAAAWAATEGVKTVKNVGAQALIKVCMAVGPRITSPLFRSVSDPCFLIALSYGMDQGRLAVDQIAQAYTQAQAQRAAQQAAMPAPPPPPEMD